VDTAKLGKDISDVGLIERQISAWVATPEGQADMAV